MELYIIVIVLFGALLHAIWNSMIKSGKSPLMDSMLISVVWALIAIVILPFLPIPDLASWPYAFITMFVHVAYFFLLVKSYEIGDFSRVYPIVRGLPPLIVAVLSFLILGENISFYGWVGVFTISAGILVLELGNKIPSKKVFFISVLTQR